jgi:hypothetical protein
MSFSIKLLEDMPILLVTIEGDFTVELICQMFEQSAAYASQTNRLLYRMVDTTCMTSSFIDVVQMVRVAGTDIPGSPRDPRLVSMFIGSNAITRLSADLMRQKQLNMPVFPNCDEALRYIYRHMVEERTTA